MAEKNIVLYADDDSDDIQLVKEAFANYSKNVELISVPDGYEALSYLKNLPASNPLPCLIILDINMPKMDGKEALAKIRAMRKYENVPAILFTTSSQLADKEFASRYNAGFFTKPLDFKQMEYIAEQFISHCAQDIQKEISRNPN